MKILRAYIKNVFRGGKNKTDGSLLSRRFRG